MGTLQPLPHRPLHHRRPQAQGADCGRALRGDADHAVRILRRWPNPRRHPLRHGPL